MLQLPSFHMTSPNVSTQLLGEGVSSQSEHKLIRSDSGSGLGGSGPRPPRLTTNSNKPEAHRLGAAIAKAKHVECPLVGNGVHVFPKSKRVQAQGTDPFKWAVGKIGEPQISPKLAPSKKGVIPLLSYQEGPL